MAFVTDGFSREPSGGSSDFLSLTDTPDSYSGMAAKAVAVNTAGTGLEFKEFPTGGGGGTDFLTVLENMLHRQSITIVDDYKVELGDYVGLYLADATYHNGWAGNPTNAKYTVASGYYGYVVAYSGLGLNGDGCGVQFQKKDFGGEIISRTSFPPGYLRFGLPVQGSATPKRIANSDGEVELRIYGDGGYTYTAGGWVILKIVAA